MHDHLLYPEMVVVCRTTECEDADREWKVKSLTVGSSWQAEKSMPQPDREIASTPALQMSDLSSTSRHLLKTSVYHSQIIGES